MAKKFYAVKNGRQTGIFKTWPECQRQVTGFKGAAFKGFETLEEAEAFIAGGAQDTSPREGAAVAYVDGSYDQRDKRFSYGMVLFCNGETITKNEAFRDPELAEMRNVAGEIKGAQEAMLYCVENGIEKLDIYYDYAGIECWCTGAWKTNKTGTIAYRAFYDWAKTKVDIRFIKVKGHSGDKYNDMADKLAKEALGL
ncbi:MAG: viroplasmin family protein [Candidatus Ornithomonoglobus sp.]